MGKTFANGRNSITLQSLRWFVQTTVERATGREVVGYYWIGKEQKSYQWEPNSEKELKDLYKIIEPELTFMNRNIISQQGEAQQAQIDYLKKQLEIERKQRLIDKFDSVIDQFLNQKHHKSFTLTPNDQLKYFLSRPEAKRLKPEEISIIKEYVNSGECKKVSVHILNDDEIAYEEQTKDEL